MQILFNANGKGYIIIFKNYVKLGTLWPVNTHCSDSRIINIIKMCIFKQNLHNKQQGHVKWTSWKRLMEMGHDMSRNLNENFV